MGTKGLLIVTPVKEIRRRHAAKSKVLGSGTRRQICEGGSMERQEAFAARMTSEIGFFRSRRLPAGIEAGVRRGTSSESGVTMFLQGRLFV